MSGLFIVYKRKTKRILQTMQGPDSEERRENTKRVVETINAKLPSSRQVSFIYCEDCNIECEKHFLDDNLLPTPKTAFPSLQVSNGHLAGLPKHTMVYWPDGETSVPDDGKIEFDSNVAITIKLTLYNPRHFTEDIEVKYAI